MSYQISIHSSCICNEMYALTNRHLIDRSYIKFEPNRFRAATLRLKRLFPKYVEPITFGDYINRYTGAKKQVYRRALYNLTVGGLRKQHAKVKMFVKPDRFPKDVIYDKPPRAIQFRSPEFNLVWGTMLHPVEKWTYENLKLGESKTKNIAKGLNPYERAELLIEKTAAFDDPCFLLVDHSKFDSTINEHHLKCTHAIYGKMIKNQLFYKCSRAQLINKGRTKSGISYKVVGTRMSGDYDTGLGNCLVNMVAITGVLYDSGITKFDILIDGDDSIIIIEKNAQPMFRKELFEAYGFETKFSYVDNIYEAEFCQSKLCLAQRPVMVRNPRRALSHANCTLRHYAGKAVNQWISGVGLCELSLNQGVPILQAFGFNYFKHYHRYKIDDDFARRMVRVDLKKTEIPISHIARLTFEAAWDIPIWLQLKMEQYDWTSRAYKSYITKAHKLADYVKTVATVRTSRAGFRTLDTDSGPGWWATGPECV